MCVIYDGILKLDNEEQDDYSQRLISKFDVYDELSQRDLIERLVQMDQNEIHRLILKQYSGSNTYSSNKVDRYLHPILDDETLSPSQK